MGTIELTSKTTNAEFHYKGAACDLEGSVTFNMDGEMTNINMTASDKEDGTYMGNINAYGGVGGDMRISMSDITPDNIVGVGGDAKDCIGLLKTDVAPCMEEEESK